MKHRSEAQTSLGWMVQAGREAIERSATSKRAAERSNRRGCSQRSRGQRRTTGRSLRVRMAPTGSSEQMTQWIGVRAVTGQTPAGGAVRNDLAACTSRACTSHSARISSRASKHSKLLEVGGGQQQQRTGEDNRTIKLLHRSRCK